MHQKYNSTWTYRPAYIIAEVMQHYGSLHHGNMVAYLKAENLSSKEHTEAKDLNEKWKSLLVNIRVVACFVAIAAISAVAITVPKPYAGWGIAGVGIVLFIVALVTENKLRQSKKIANALNDIPLKVLR